MSGHIQLDGRDYLLINPEQRIRTIATPFAAKLGSGAGDYDDLENWSAWVQDNWQAGIGQKDPEAGGTLYSELETRFSGQLMLPPRVYEKITSEASGGGGNVPNVAIEINTYGGSASQKFAVNYTGAIGDPQFFVAIRGEYGTVLKASIYDHGIGFPGSTELATTTITITERFGFNVYQPIFSYTEATTDPRWVVFEANTPGELFDLESDGIAGATWNGSVWSLSGLPEPRVVVDVVDAASIPHVKLVRWSDDSWAITETRIVKYASNSWTSPFTVSSTIVDAQVFGSNLYLGYGAAADMDEVTDTSGTKSAITSQKATLLTSWRGYLWKAHENDIWYSADGTTWTGPIQVGPDGYEIRGMAGMGEVNMWVSTDEALYFVGAGDFVFGVAQWATIDSNNGAGMIHHQGDLYIPVGNSLYRYTSGGQFLDIGPNTQEGLPANKQGRISALASHNHWLFAATTTDTATGFSIVWAYNGQGWHFIAKIPQGITIISMLYDRELNYLFCMGDDYLTYHVTTAVLNENPYKDGSGTYKFGITGHIETDWFYGGLREIVKDFESVYISGENFSSTRYAEVYWQDEDSTAWELLGTVTSNRKEIRWSTVATRPASRQIKLAIVLYSDDENETPIVNAIRVKYHANIDDRYRWNLPIAVSDNQQMLDGSINPYNQQQQENHLDELEQKVPPVIFQDINGTKYEVKVVQSSQQMLKVEYLKTQGVITYDAVYNFTIEQVNSDEYTG